MKFDFSKEAYFDNHTHYLYADKLNCTSEEFLLNYYHGVRDIEGLDGTPEVSKTEIEHLNYQSVVMMLVHAMAERFGCEPTAEGCTAFRNSRTKTPESLLEYTRLLFEDQNIIGCMLDDERPMDDDTVASKFPCKVFRLFRYEDVFFELLESEDRFEGFLAKFLDRIRKAYDDGFSGLKGHIGERFGFGVYEVSDSKASSAFLAAKNGDANALKDVYYSAFGHLLELSGELDFPVHLHTGTTGFKSDTLVYSLDPILMAPFLKNKRFYKAKIILLHGSFPFTRNAAWMAYNFPNVYVDLSQTGLWQGALMNQILEDVLSCVPHDKILLGTGQHRYCEMVWLAARIAKASLSRTMSNLVDMNLISSDQAIKSAKMILSENALRLYQR